MERMRLGVITRMRPPRVRRLVQLYAGLVLFGVSSSMLLLAGLGVDPWDVFHQGLSRRFGLGVGTWAIIVGVLVLLLWIPLRQKPGFGTLSNVVLVGLVIDVMLAVVPPVHGLPAQIVVMLGGVVLNGIATGAYIGAGLGPGPRDGLMTGLAARGHSIRIVRTSIELTVLVTGWLLGGTVGVGTVVYALGIGPIAHVTIPRLRIPLEEPVAAAGGDPVPTCAGAIRSRRAGASRPFAHKVAVSALTATRNSRGPSLLGVVLNARKEAACAECASPRQSCCWAAACSRSRSPQRAIRHRLRPPPPRRPSRRDHRRASASRTPRLAGR